MSRWSEGPPPAPGWFEASNGHKPTPGVYRWWDGLSWSRPIFGLNHAAEFAAVEAGKPDGLRYLIRWRHQPRDWPAHARTYHREAIK